VKAGHVSFGDMMQILKGGRTGGRERSSESPPAFPPCRLPALAALALMAACTGPKSSTVRLPSGSPERRGLEPPVVINPDPGVEYPQALYEQGIEGKVVLRLFVDSAGALVRDSTRIAESSGYPALDSAALRAAPGFRFAPARDNDVPVSAAFLQPVQFRHPPRGGMTP
jgi:periplasmic protein TonB